MLASPLDLPASSGGYALSPLQQGMLVHQLGAPEAGFDIVHVVFTIDALLDVERLRAAWQRASDRYDALRTTIRWNADRPLQEPLSDVTVPFTFEKRLIADPAERERFVAACIAEERRRGMPLSSFPLQRVRLIRHSRTRHTLIWTNHHAILDGRARAIVLRDIIDAYAGRPLHPPGPAFRAHIAWLERRDAAQSEAFWRDYLRGVAAATPLPVPASDLSASPGLSTAVATRTLDVQATAPLRAFAAAHALSMNTVLQAAWSLLLSRHAGTPDVVFGAVRACRESGVAGSAGIVGLLINALPMRVRVDEATAVVPWLQHVRSQWAALRSVEHTPLREIVGWSEIAAPAPLFESLLVYERETLEHTVRRLDPDGVLGVRGVYVADRTTAPLALAASGTDELHLRLQTDTQRFANGDGERLLDQLITIVQSIPLQAGGCVRDISMIDPAEERRIVQGFNSHSDFPRDDTVHALFSEHAARTPDAVAAQIGASTMTYRELAARSDAVAVGLQGYGIGPGSYVALCVERSFDMLAALLGILKAGAASIAIDPTHPAERSAFMLEDAAVTIVLAQTALIGDLENVLARAPNARIVALEPLQAGRDSVPAAVPAGTDPAAHVMYTSGSTGRPKGAVIGHRAVVRTVRGADYLHFGPDETFFAFVPLTFDVAILEIWGPLLNGARLVLCPPGLPSLDVLAQTIERHGVTTLWLTTALFEQMVDEQLPRLRGLRQLIVGGDVMSPAHARRALAALPATRLVNVCGPTEATVLIVAHQLTAPPNGPIPLGKPIANATVYILDAAGRPVPIGVPGEIYTGGDGVAHGYLNRPALTAERFLPDPFAPAPGSTMYRTGDLARWRADGSIDFIGRADTQLKIRGIRVELGEIECALTDHPAVREAVAGA
ncbi:MAG TPA: amino acid adenylation domain-containing protein, partial [Candidatus Lustribacter sp.]